MSITVLKPGMLSSFQDLGRHGHQHLGVPVGGAMDGRAHRLANLLVGNVTDEATLEVTLAGPQLRFEAPACIAICGAQLSPAVNGAPVPNNRPLIMRAGDLLSFGARDAGLRAYIAFHGGPDLSPVLGSCSTYLRGALGGFQGRALKKDDVIPLRVSLQSRDLDALAERVWQLRVYLPAILGVQARTSLRVVRGAQAGQFTEASVQAFFGSEYRVSPESDRMGYRLQGPTLALRDKKQLPSEATSFGSIQVPPDGRPIVLMADRQTTGGYAKIAHVASVDLPILAQSMPGDVLQFAEVSLDDARALDSLREEALGRLEETLAPLRGLLVKPGGR